MNRKNKTAVRRRIITILLVRLYGSKFIVDFSETTVTLSLNLYCEINILSNAVCYFTLLFLFKFLIDF